MSEKFDITRYTIVSEKIPPEFDGAKIAHVSDFHSRPCEGAADIIAAEAPDIIAVTGDILHDDSASAEPAARLMRALCSISPVYFVTGNHDERRPNHAKTFQTEFPNAVWLDNRCAVFEKGGAKIMLCGISDPFSKIPARISRNIGDAFSQLNKSLNTQPHPSSNLKSGASADTFPDTLSGAPSKPLPGGSADMVRYGYDGFKILLFHRANLFDEIKDYPFDLILSGHMHGGQIRLPYLGGVLAPLSSALSHERMLFPRYTAGRTDYGGKTMIINRGLANTLPFPRFGNPCEIGIITLRCAD